MVKYAMCFLSHLLLCFFSIQDFISRMQDILDNKSPLHINKNDRSDSEDINKDEDEVFSKHMNVNYNKAEEEFNYFENFKKKKYR